MSHILLDVPVTLALAGSDAGRGGVLLILLRGLLGVRNLVNFFSLVGTKADGRVAANILLNEIVTLGRLNFLLGLERFLLDRLFLRLEVLLFVGS